jgi:tRNA (cmo5U34)-methyltransferase
MAKLKPDEPGASVEEQWGHHWKEADRVRDYVERTDREAAERASSFRYLVGLVPFDASHPLRILDIGSGHGVLAAALLDTFASSQAVGLDVSEPMMEIGRQRMARFDTRFSYHVGDFADGDLPADLTGPFDVAISSRAIHHLPGDNKRRLYRGVFQRLNPGGCFFNLDVVGPSDEYLRDRYRQASELVNGPRPQPTVPTAARTSAHGHFPEPVHNHLRFLKEAGFDPVDCFWQQLGNALVGGYRRA